MQYQSLQVQSSFEMLYSNDSFMALHTNIRLSCPGSEGTNTLAYLLWDPVKEKKGFKLLISVEELSRNYRHYRYSLFMVHFDLNWQSLGPYSQHSISLVT